MDLARDLEPKLAVAVMASKFQIEFYFSPKSPFNDYTLSDLAVSCPLHGPAF